MMLRGCFHASHSHQQTGRRCLPPSSRSPTATAVTAQRGSGCCCGVQQRPPVSAQVSSMVLAAVCVFFPQAIAAAFSPAHAAELLESNLQSEGNIPSELSAAGEQQAPPLSSLLQGSNKKQIEGCTRRCVPTCIRGGEGSPGLGPISLRREIVVFKDGFRSRQYCLSECAQVCKLISDNEQQQRQQQQHPPPPQQQQQPQH